jgi:hypothetical protein
MLTRIPRLITATLPLLLLALTGPTPARAQVAGAIQVTTPAEEFGHELGADYQLINYQQFTAYVNKLADQSDRMTVQAIGQTELAREQLMAVITSPENHADLDRYREIARRLALADGISADDARALAEEGKAVVWIDGGLHATEVLGAQQLTELIYRMVSYDDPETLRILDDVILLAVHANPDGHDLVADWYMRHDDPMERTTSGVPLLYNHYAGHDNNRDFYMSNLAETTNMNRVMYREWFPQIIYNHHQTGPDGAIMFAPPFRDPPNHHLDPLIITSLDQVGSAMHARFVKEGKGGTTMRSGASYSTWWNGGLRTTPYFKNMIGLLTETHGHPTPIEISFRPAKQITHGDLPLPVEPGLWHFRQSVEYSQTANWAVLDYASRNRDRLLFNIWRMASNAIDRGRTDSWTVLPDRIDLAAEDVGESGDRDDWERLLRAPGDRDARAYVLSAHQADFLTATKFVNALLKNGVEVLQATSPFRVAGEAYPAGSYVVRADQAFRPHVLDMFEPQNHPNDFAYPGAPPTAPYDNAGWTLAYQMDVDFERVLEDFDGPFEAIEWLAEAPAGEVTGEGDVAGWILSHEVNDAFLGINRLLAAGHDIYWLNGGGEHHGDFFVDASSGSEGDVRELAAQVGLDFHGVAGRPAGEVMKLRPAKVGLWDRYGGSMPSGWTRFVLERFGFDFDLLYAQQLEGDLSDYDVLIFPDGAIPMTDETSGRERRRDSQPDAQDVPEQYRHMLGRTSVASTVPAVLDFARQGGTVIAVGSSTSLAYHAQLPVEDHLTRGGVPLPSEEYYVPGSVLDVKLEQVSPVTHGLGERADVLFSRSPVFKVRDGAAGVRTLGWFDRTDPLRSGWAWGQHHLAGGAALLEADVGQGKLFLYGPRVTFRGQAHGTFPLVFNAIFYGTAETLTLQAQDGQPPQDL